MPLILQVYFPACDGCKVGKLKMLVYVPLLPLIAVLLLKGKETVSFIGPKSQSKIKSSVTFVFRTLAEQFKVKPISAVVRVQA